MSNKRCDCSNSVTDRDPKKRDCLTREWSIMRQADYWGRREKKNTRIARIRGGTREGSEKGKKYVIQVESQHRVKEK